MKPTDELETEIARLYQAYMNAPIFPPLLAALVSATRQSQTSEHDVETEIEALKAKLNVQCDWIQSKDADYTGYVSKCVNCGRVTTGTTTMVSAFPCLTGQALVVSSLISNARQSYTVEHSDEVNEKVADNLDEVLTDLSRSAWSMGLQGASKEALDNPRQNRMTINKAKAAIIARQSQSRGEGLDEIIGKDEQYVELDYPKVDDEGEPLWSKRAIKESRKQRMARVISRNELRAEQRAKMVPSPRSRGKRGWNE